MKLFYYGIDNNLGGLENYARTLITSLIKLDNQLEIIIISCYSDYAYRDYFESLGVCSIIVPNYKKNPFKYRRALIGILKNHSKEDLIQLNIMSYRNIALFSAIKKAKIRTCVVGHASNMQKGIINNVLNKMGLFFYRKFGKKIAISNEVIPYLFKGDKKVTLIPNGIDLDSYSFDMSFRKKIRTEYNLDESFVIGQVGRLSYAKNQIFSADLIERLAEDIPNVKLMLLGKNQDDHIYQQIINCPNILYIGEVDNASKYYSAFDLQIMPSNFEGFSLSVLEGLQNGLSVFISDKVPLPDKIGNKITRIQLDIDEWVKEIEKNIKLRNSLPASGIEKYSSLIMAKRYLEIYNQ